MSTRIAVTKCLNLITIRALTTNGRFGSWTAKTWAYMSHANGPWYTMGPLFLAGLSATAVISILPTTVFNPDHFVYFNTSLLYTDGSWSLALNDSLTRRSGFYLGTDLLQSYMNGYATGVGFDFVGLGISGQVTSNRSLGYPWYLVDSERSAELEKYNITGDEFQESNKTSCVWVLDKVPVRCSFTNYTVFGSRLDVVSPYSQQVYSISNVTTPPQGVTVGDSLVGDQSEIAGTGIFRAEPGTYPNTAYICTTREVSTIHLGRYITTQYNGYVTGTYIDIANSSECQPAYQLPSPTAVHALMGELARALYQFASVDGTNSLINVMLDSGAFARGPLFADSTSQLEDGIGGFLATLLSLIYVPSIVEQPPFGQLTKVTGGQMKSSVGLGESSNLYLWLLVAVIPLSTLVISILMPEDYIPTWDVMNTLDALATPAVIDEEKAAQKSRSSGLRLGVLEGRIVASNTNLPTRISKGDLC